MESESETERREIVIEWDPEFIEKVAKHAEQQDESFSEFVSKSCRKKLPPEKTDVGD